MLKENQGQLKLFFFFFKVARFKFETWQELDLPTGVFSLTFHDQTTQYVYHDLFENLLKSTS